MNYIIDNFDINNFFMPQISEKYLNSKDIVDMQESLEKKNYIIHNPTKDDLNKDFILGDSTWQIIYFSDTESNENNKSIVIELKHNDKKYLFAGDIESKIENSKSWDNIDLLKVAHHASDTSTTENFLQQTTPTYAVISAGNSTKIFDESTYALLQRFLLKQNIFITRNNGSVFITNFDTPIYLKTKVDSTQH